MTEERARFEVLMENVDTSLKVLAEAHVAQVERLDRIDGRLERLETKVDRIDMRVGILEAKVDKLEVFAGDTQQRLGRIETHLHMNGAHPRRSPQQPTKRSKKR